MFDSFDWSDNGKDVGNTGGGRRRGGALLMVRSLADLATCLVECTATCLGAVLNNRRERADIVSLSLLHCNSGLQWPLATSSIHVHSSLGQHSITGW